MKTKIKVVGLIVLTFAIIFFFYYKGNSSQDLPSNQIPSQNSQNDSPQIVSTKPDPLENTIVSTTEVIEITFSRPLQNPGEFKLRIEPKIEFSIDLSNDRKTAKVTFTKPLELGITYTMFIGPDTKFDGTGNWGMEKIYHFRTITYRGV